MIGNIGEEDELKIDISELENKENSIFQVKKAVIHHCKHCCRVLGKENKKTLDENTHRIEEYIKENYKRSITIKEMSKELYVNPVYLGQLFKKIFGMRFSDYVHQLRIDEAKRLLEETTMEMSEIAREVGYSSYNAFLKYFEKNTGTKPADYKNKI
jgi:two-component system response regulator YesN